MDTKRYSAMEPVLNYINSNFIALPENDTKHSMKILKSLLKILTDKMRESDVLFKALYREVFHGGSYFDGLRIGQAKEYDLDLVLAIPRCGKPKLTVGDVPGFVNLEMTNFNCMLKQKEYKTLDKKPLRDFGKLCDKNHYLNTDKVLSFTESVLDRALQEFTNKDDGKCFLHYDNGKFQVTKTKSGPAITLKLKQVDLKRKNRRDPFSMDIDLVPAFVFRREQWPSDDFRSWPHINSADFFIVPKAPKGQLQQRERYWRLSFQKQERIVMNGKQNLKPTIRLLKKMRDVLDQKSVASYYIKTIVLWMIENMEENFWKKPLGYVFMTALKKYHECITKGSIPYYWNKNNNLLCEINKETLINYSNRLRNVITDIESNLDSSTLPTIIVGQLLNDDEKEKFHSNYL